MPRAVCQMAMSKIAAKVQARKSDLIDMTAPLYAEKFTVAELKEIGAFYKTPIGQKLLRTMKFWPRSILGQWYDSILQ